MWENRNSYTALSVLPHADHTYIQAPFEQITEIEYYQKLKVLHDINLNNVIETEDNTEQRESIACSGAGGGETGCQRLCPSRGVHPGGPKAHLAELWAEGGLVCLDVRELRHARRISRRAKRRTWTSIERLGWGAWM